MFNIKAPVLFYILFSLHLTGYVFCQTENHFFRKDYTYIEETQSFYKLHRVARPWIEARRACLWEGATLYYPRDEAEERLINRQMLNANDPSIYIGVSSLIVKGIFETVDGLLITDVYNTWSPGEPNNASGGENCVIVHPDGTLNDIPCSSNAMFICKKSLETLHWNELCNMPDNGYVYNGDQEKCYKMHLRPRTWAEAHGFCRAEQSYLAVVNSHAEANFLTSLIEQSIKPKDKEKLNAAIHLGFHNKYGEGWETITGVDLEDSGYAIWADTDIEENEQQECGSMLFNGQLKDVNCFTKHFFICEHDVDRTINKSNDECHSYTTTTKSTTTTTKATTTTMSSYPINIETTRESNNNIDPETTIISINDLYENVVE